MNEAIEEAEKPKTVFVVYDQTESLAQSIAADVVTFSFMLLCIYVSRDSTFWTFTSGVLFILFIAGKVAFVGKSQKTVLRSKEAALRWAQSL